MTTLLDLRSNIESMVRTILDDANRRHPHTMDELLHQHEFRNHATALTEPASDPLTVLDTDTTAFEVLRASLGLIFGQRYGWTEEKIDDMTMPEVFIALEHAMEYDAPSKKSVWNL